MTVNISRARVGALSAAVRSRGFVWLTGIEDTFILAPHPGTGRTLDEYALTDHYARWTSDLGLAAQLGVQAMRYGLPWHRINPARNVWDFSWVDGPIELLLEHGIEPVIDLVHYGVPSWIEGAFANPDYDQRVTEYAVRVAERYRGRVAAFTPLNEPRITAWYAGMLGWWPPFGRGWKGFVRVLLAVCRGIVRSERALRSVLPDLVSVHVDAADVYSSDDPELADEARRREQIAFLALDLVSGRVGESHPLFHWLLRLGTPLWELRAFAEEPLTLDVIGLNTYPLFSRKILRRKAGRLRIQMPYAGPELIDQLVQSYHGRYGRPLIISETASEGRIARRLAWLQGSVQAVQRARARGVPIVGYTWWPMFALVAWAYRQGQKPIAAYLRQMGLWDLEIDSNGELQRVPTPLVEAYRDIVNAGMPRTTAARFVQPESSSQPAR